MTGLVRVVDVSEMPDFVRNSYTKSQLSHEAGLTHEQARRNIARNQIILGMREKGLSKEALYEQGIFNEKFVTRFFEGNPRTLKDDVIKSVAAYLNIDLSDLYRD